MSKGLSLIQMEEGGCGVLRDDRGDRVWSAVHTCFLELAAWANQAIRRLEPSQMGEDQTITASGFACPEMIK
jgi:hypothetical protein